MPRMARPVGTRVVGDQRRDFYEVGRDAGARSRRARCERDGNRGSEPASGSEGGNGDRVTPRNQRKLFLACPSNVLPLSRERRS